MCKSHVFTDCRKRSLPTHTLLFLISLWSHLKYLEENVQAWHCRASTSLVEIKYLWLPFLDQNRANNKKEQYCKTTLGTTQHFYCISLSPISEFRFMSNRFKCAAYHLSTQNASLYVSMSLLLTTTINLWTIKNLPESCRESGALDCTLWKETRGLVILSFLPLQTGQCSLLFGLSSDFSASVASWFFWGLITEENKS